MIAIAVNCLEQEARRKLVRGSIFAALCKSRKPYPRSKSFLPSLITNTATPGECGVTSGANIASKFLDMEDEFNGTCAPAFVTTPANARKPEASVIISGVIIRGIPRDVVIHS